MSDTITPITITDSEWYVRPSADGSCYEICRGDTDEVIAVADEPGDASLMACGKNMLTALIAIQHILTFDAPDAPVVKSRATADEINLIMDVINVPFGKLANEVTL